jgi:hypothetical protein
MNEGPAGGSGSPEVASRPVTLEDVERFRASLRPLTLAELKQTFETAAGPGRALPPDQPYKPFAHPLTGTIGQLANRDRMNFILVAHARGRLTASGLAALLGDWWDSSEGAGSGAGVRVWVDLFRIVRDAGLFVTDTPGVVAPEVGTIVTIYRGAVPWRARGMSWTLDQERAIWFARRSRLMTRGQGSLFSALIPAEHVLGRFDGRQEQEVVVDPRRLRRVRELPVPAEPDAGDAQA